MQMPHASLNEDVTNSICLDGLFKCPIGKILAISVSKHQFVVEKGIVSSEAEMQCLFYCLLCRPCEVCVIDQDETWSK